MLRKPSRCARCPRTRCTSIVSVYRLAQSCQLLDEHHAPFVVLRREERTDARSKPAPESQQKSLSYGENIWKPPYCIERGEHHILGQSRHTLHPPKLLLPAWTSRSSLRSLVAAVLKFNRLLICTVKVCRAQSYLVCECVVAISDSYAN